MVKEKGATVEEAALTLELQEAGLRVVFVPHARHSRADVSPLHLKKRTVVWSKALRRRGE